MAYPKLLSRDQLKERLRVRLGTLLERNTDQGGSSRLTRELIATHLRGVLEAAGDVRISAEEREQLIAELAAEIVGVGPLETLLADPQIGEIMVNGAEHIYVDRDGRLEKVSARFQDSDHVMAVIERLLDSVGVSVSGSEPCVDAALPDGTRLHVIIPPIALNGPILTIRKPARRWTVDALIANGTFSPQAAEFLKACVGAKANILVSGATSTGKTTLVTILASWIPTHERIISIENVAELDLQDRTHWIRLVSRSANLDGKGEVSLRTLVRNALRMRPDRLILGEARAAEAVDVLQAMHTGHDGVITILHANSPHAALERLETLILMSGMDIPPQICRTQIASAVDLLIHMGRFADGSRRVAAVSQLLGSSPNGFDVEELFVFEAEGFSASGELHGACRYTGAKPKFLSKFRLNNVEVPAWVRTS